jgi:plasmid stabilization system protein ParE
MTLAVDFRHAARREFDEAALWYEERRPGLGLEFAGEINRAIGLMMENPERFPIMHRDVRCVRARRFPYSVFFRAESRRIVVLAVFHARRDPSVWKQRT